MTEITQPKWDNIDDEITFSGPTVFCDNCRKDVEFFVHRTRKYGLWHGVRYRYKGKKANCRECGSTVILPEIIAYNMRKLAAESQKTKYKESSDES